MQTNLLIFRNYRSNNFVYSMSVKMDTLSMLVSSMVAHNKVLKSMLPLVADNIVAGTVVDIAADIVVDIVDIVVGIAGIAVVHSCIVYIAFEAFLELLYHNETNLLCYIEAN